MTNLNSDIKVRKVLLKLSQTCYILTSCCPAIKEILDSLDRYYMAYRT